MKHDNSFITDYCEEKGIFLKDLAKLVGVHEQSVYNHVHGRRISVPNYIKYSKVIPDLPWEIPLGEVCCTYEKKGYKRVDLIWEVLSREGTHVGVEGLPFGYFDIFRWGECSLEEKNQIDTWLGYDSDLHVYSSEDFRAGHRKKSALFSGVLKDYREGKGLTQKQFGRLVDLSRATIQNYERGVLLPDPTSVEKLAKVVPFFRDMQGKLFLW